MIDWQPGKIDISRMKASQPPLREGRGGKRDSSSTGLFLLPFHWIPLWRTFRWSNRENVAAWLPAIDSPTPCAPLLPLSLMNYSPFPFFLFPLFLQKDGRIWIIVRSTEGEFYFPFEWENNIRCELTKLDLISQSSYETRTPLRDPLRGDLLSLFQCCVYTGWRKRKKDDLKGTK